MSKVLLATSAIGLGTSCYAATAPSFGNASSFAVLAGTQVSSLGNTVISGDLGVSPGTLLTGFPPGTVTNGAIHLADSVSYLAQVDAAYAAVALSVQTLDQNLSGSDLGGKTLVPGVYYFADSAALTGELKLDAQNDANAVFIFQVKSSFSAADLAKVTVMNGGSYTNVFFMVGGSAIIGADAAIQGNIIATSNIALNQGATIAGKALALNGSVSLNQNMITNAVVVVPTPTPSPTATPVPSPTPLPIQPTVLAGSCTFVEAGKNPISCQATGQICIDGDIKCLSTKNPIYNQLIVNCTDGFSLSDMAATTLVNRDSFSWMGMASNYNSSKVDLQAFNSHAGTFESNLTFNYSGQTAKSIAGSCVLK